MIPRKRKSRIRAPAAVLFTTAANEAGEKQLCVMAQCLYVGITAGPVWGHEQRSVNRVMADLTRTCQCGRPFHHIREYQGHRVLTKRRHHE